MLGLGVLKGLAVTLSRFVATYVEDLKFFPRRYSEEALSHRQRLNGRGLFTVEYPEQELKVPENFRYLPFLLYDENKESVFEGIRCTSCGICAKVCPPQCIWIVRSTDAKGKPIPQPAEFYIDVDICMNCGYCAEFCPFDAIKMDHDWKLSDFEREEAHIHDLDRLLKPVSYYASIRPSFYAQEEEARRATEEAKAAKEEQKAKVR